MSHSNLSAKLLWTNRNGNVGTTLTASGDSGTPLVDLRYASALWLAVSVTGTVAGTTPTLDVYLDVMDAAGDWFTHVAHATPQLTAAGQAQVSTGLFLPSGAGLAPLVLPEYGRVSWAVGGTANPKFDGAVISLYGR